MNENPGAASSGPPVEDHELLGRDDVPLFVRGRLLGFASSQTDEHKFHPPGEFAQRGSRCSACRWFECRIFEVAHELSDVCTCPAATTAADADTSKPSAWELRRAHVQGRPHKGAPLQVALKQHDELCGVLPQAKPFLVLTYGLSDVPDEVDKRRASWTDSPYEIIELLTQRGREDRQAFLPAASARALAQAAGRNEAIREAYINRAVV